MENDRSLNSPVACCEGVDCAVELKSRRSATETGRRRAQPLTPPRFVWHTSGQVPWPPRSATRRRAERDTEIESIRVTVFLELPAWCGSSQPRRASSPSREVDGDDPRAAPAPTSVRPQESRHGSLRFCLLLLRLSVQQYSAFPRLPRFLLRPSRNVDGRALATPYAEGAARRHASAPNVWGASPRSPPSISRDAACWPARLTCHTSPVSLFSSGRFSEPASEREGGSRKF